MNKIESFQKVLSSTKDTRYAGMRSNCYILICSDNSEHRIQLGLGGIDYRLLNEGELHSLLGVAKGFLAEADTKAKKEAYHHVVSDLEYTISQYFPDLRSQVKELEEKLARCEKACAKLRAENSEHIRDYSAMVDIAMHLICRSTEYNHEDQWGFYLDNEGNPRIMERYKFHENPSAYEGWELLEAVPSTPEDAVNLD